MSGPRMSEVGLTVSVKKANQVPEISVGNNMLELVKEFSYLWFTISVDPSLDRKIDTLVGKAAATMVKLFKRV